MQTALDVAYDGMEPSSSLRERIEHEAAKLERFAPRITACHVAVIARSGKRRHGDLYQVRIRVTAPGRSDIVVDRNPDLDRAHEDPYVAVRDAFDAARRRLQDHERRLSGKTKHHEEAPRGRIARLFPGEGYGFIETPDGLEIYFHRNAVLNGDFDKLSPGAEVGFAEEPGEKGPQASTVRLLGR